jgi:hypothetical protein
MNQNARPDPTVVGLFLVAAAIIGGLFPLQAGFVSMSAAPIVGVFLLFSGIAWLVLMGLCWWIGDFFGMSLNGIFGVLFGLCPGAALLVDLMGAGSGIKFDSRITGWYLMYTGFLFLIVAFPAGKRLWSMMLTFLVIWAAATLTGLVFAGFLPASVMRISCWLFLYIGVWFTYMGTAIMINTVFQKPIFPIGGPLFK